jgi:DNA mismatch repair protein MutL
MGIIRVLSPQVANAIAAGEVVERPASAVKELVENSVDAGAHRITVEVERAGLALIRVSDDGSGMSRDDAELAFQRHATSKVASADDLHRITTMGFRGEALPSIAAVARVRLLTRSQGGDEGTEVRVEGGGRAEVAPGAARPGTVVEVRDLFYNVPARRKFLKSLAAESAAVGDIVSSLALAHPSVHFRYFSDGREILNAPPAAEPLDRVLAVLGMDVADEMVPVDANDGPLSLSGLTSHVSLTRASPSDQYFIVNHRPVRAKALQAAVKSAYKGRVMVGRHPIVVLYLDVPPDEVDVNVHPTKAEVRFRDEKRHGSLVEQALRAVLELHARVAAGPLKTRPVGGGFEPPAPGVPRERAASAGGSVSQSTPAPAQAVLHQRQLAEVAHGLERVASAQALAKIQEAFEGAKAGAGRATLPPMEPVSQIGNKYILARTPAGLAIIDQHAAAERFAYETLGDALSSGAVESQQLIDPVVLLLHPREVDLALERTQDLKAVGFDVERFGPRQLRVLAVPAMLGDHADAALLHDILSEALQDVGPSPDEELRDRLVAVTACHYSLRAGEAVDFRGMARIIENLYQCRNPFHCIHGRPTVIVTTIEDLDKMFKRTGPA